MQFLDKTGLAYVWSKIAAKFVPVTRTINGKALNANITLAAADVSAVPTTRKINNKALSADITLSATDVSAVPTTRTINGKALSSNITLSASDVSARSNTWVPALTDCTGTLTIAKGGTGAIDAATALINLGAVNKSGDTMTGTLKNTHTIIYNSSWPTLAFASDVNTNTGSVYQNQTSRRIGLSQYASGSSYAENYSLPVPDAVTESKWYNILTSKSAVTVAQGGTGATNAANARTNLGITPANIGAAPSEHTHKYLDAYSGTGTVGFGISDSGFWARAQRNGINAEYLYMTKDGQKVYTYNSEGTYVQTLHGTTNVLYSSTQPTGQFKGQLWLKPV